MSLTQNLWLVFKIYVLKKIQGQFLLTWKTNYLNIWSFYIPAPKNVDNSVYLSVNYPIPASEVLSIYFFFFLSCLFPSPHYALAPWDLRYWISSLRGICCSLLAEPIINKKEKQTKKQINIIPSHSLQRTFIYILIFQFNFWQQYNYGKKHCLTQFSFTKCLLLNSSPRYRRYKHSHKLQKSYSEHKQIKCAS